MLRAARRAGQEARGALFLFCEAARGQQSRSPARNAILCAPRPRTRTACHALGTCAPMASRWRPWPEGGGARRPPWGEAGAPHGATVHSESRDRSSAPLWRFGRPRAARAAASPPPARRNGRAARPMPPLRVIQRLRRGARAVGAGRCRGGRRLTRWAHPGDGKKKGGALCSPSSRTSQGPARRCSRAGRGIGRSCADWPRERAGAARLARGAGALCFVAKVEVIGSPQTPRGQTPRPQTGGAEVGEREAAEATLLTYRGHPTDLFSQEKHPI